MLENIVEVSKNQREIINFNWALIKLRILKFNVIFHYCL